MTLAEYMLKNQVSVLRDAPTRKSNIFRAGALEHSEPKPRGLLREDLFEIFVSSAPTRSSNNSCDDGHRKSPIFLSGAAFLR